MVRIRFHKIFAFTCYAKFQRNNINFGVACHVAVNVFEIVEKLPIALLKNVFLTLIAHLH